MAFLTQEKPRMTASFFLSAVFHFLLLSVIVLPAQPVNLILYPITTEVLEIPAVKKAEPVFLPEKTTTEKPGEEQGKTPQNKVEKPVIHVKEKSTQEKRAEIPQKPNTTPGEGKEEALAGPRTLGSGKDMVTNGPLPAYPKLAQNLGITGDVILKIVIDKEGLIESLQVLNSSDRSLEETTVKTITAYWRFKKETFSYYIKVHVKYSDDGLVSVTFLESKES